MRLTRAEIDWQSARNNAADMLARRASPYDVAKLLSDIVATVEKHYAPFVKELRNRARRVMENSKAVNGGQACKPDSVQRARVAACALWRSFL